MQRILLLPCVYLYKFFKYIFKSISCLFYYFFIGLITPFILIIKLISYINQKTKPKRLKNKEKREQRKKIKEEKIRIQEAKKLRINEKKFIKRNEEKQQKIKLLEERKKSKTKRIKQTKKKEKDIYINKNVKIENQSRQRTQEFFKKLRNIPVKIKNKIVNNSFSKNRRNKYAMKHQALLIDFEGKDAEKSDIKHLYEYIAKDPNGKVIKGYFEAFSKVEVHSFLLSEGYEVYSIKTNKWIELVHGNKKNSKVKFKTKDLLFFITQLSTYLKAGIPLVDSLKILSRQFNKNKKYRAMFKSIIYDLTMGENFSDALLKQNNAFPKLLINMIKTAEMTGELPEVLDDMYVYYTESNKTKKQMITALTYPAIVGVFAIGVIIFILVWVIPKFVTIYESMDASQIPAFTKVVISASNFLRNYSLYLIFGIILFVLVIVFLYKKNTFFRTIMQWVAMHLPVFGNTIIYNEVTTFTKTLGSLLSHNVFITESMDVLNKITNNEIYKMLISDTIVNLAKGEKISAAFENHWAFPIPAYEMLVTGEQTGELADMMSKVSEYYQELHKEQVARIKTFIEPLLTVFLTVIVGIIVLSIVIPMFGMYQSVQSY